jgi:hypothetical protein
LPFALANGNKIKNVSTHCGEIIIANCGLTLPFALANGF